MELSVNFMTRKGKSETSSLVLASSFRLLLPLETRADVMLSLLNFCDNAISLATSLETLQCALQRLVLFDTDFRHLFPSLRRNRLNPGCFQGRSNGINYYSE